MQYCSLHPWTLLPSSVTSTTGCCFRFGSVSTFLLVLFLHSSSVTYWAPTDLESSSFTVISFCLFILFMGYLVESITTNKASGGDGIPVELFQILKDAAAQRLHSICQQIWKTQQWPQNWKRSVFIPIPKKGNAKECSNYHMIALISHASRVMFRILQARIQEYIEILNSELPDVEAGF